MALFAGELTIVLITMPATASTKSASGIRMAGSEIDASRR